MYLVRKLFGSSDSNDYFKNWEPQNYQWQPNTKQAFKNMKYDNDTFKQIFEREPSKDEDVVGLSKAGVVVNCVFGLSPPPTRMNRNECELIMKAMMIMGEKDKSIGFGLSMTAGAIASVNPQCTNYWNSMNKK